MHEKSCCYACCNICEWNPWSPWAQRDRTELIHSVDADNSSFILPSVVRYFKRFGIGSVHGFVVYFDSRKNIYHEVVYTYIEFATCYNQLSKLKIDKRRHFMTLKMLHRQSINQNESGEFLAEANCRIRWLVQQIDLEYLFSYVFLIVASIEMTHRVGGKLDCRICITLISRQIVIVGHSRVNMRFLLSICIRMSRQQKGYIFKWCFLRCFAFIYMKMQKCLMKPYGKANEVIRFCHQSWFVMHNTCTHNKNILLIESQYKRVSAIDKMSLLTHF